MPLSTALYTGVSGLGANGSSLSIIGNNLANTNTIGFKGGIGAFGDVLSASMAGGSQIGRGVQLQSVLSDFTQGTLQTTQNPLDLAIQGDGFFILHTAATGGAQYYTRAGQFNLDKDGNIINPNGDFLQGYLTQQGNVLGTINVSSLNSPPKMTGWNTGVEITANLLSSQTVHDPTTTTTLNPGNFNINTSNNTVYINGSAKTINTGVDTGPGAAAALQAVLPANSGATVKYVPPSGTTPYEFKIYNAYAVDNDNNKINFSYLGQTYTAAVAPGNYATGAAYATAVQTALNGTAAGAIFTLPAPALGVYTLTNTAATTVTFNWGNSNFTPEALGFTAANLPSLAGGTGQASSSVNATGPLYIDWGNVNGTAASIYGFYNNGNIDITSGSNVIGFTELAGANSYTATIPAGTYTGATLANAIQQALNAPTPVPAAGPASGNTFTVSYNSTTNKFNIAVATGPSVGAGNTVSFFVPGVAGNTAVPQQFGFAASTAIPAFPGATSINNLATTAISCGGGGVGSVGGILASDYQVAGLDPLNAPNTSDFSTSLTAYDSLGNSHLLNVYFRKVAENTSLLSSPTTTGNRWLWWAVAPAADSTSGQTQIASQGMLEFDNGGKLVADNLGKSNVSSFNFAGGASLQQRIDFNFGQGTTQNGSGLTGTTQFGSPNSVLFQSQDGFTSGSLQSLSVDQTGTMTGTFTNGQTSTVAQVALARFIAPTQLQKQGSNLFGESSSSGQAIIGAAGTSGRGKIFSSSLEASNVDMASEFVNMIAAQRAFESNAKVISATDQLLTALENIKQ